MSSQSNSLRRGGLTAAGSVVVEEQEWGRLEWMVSGTIGNSDTLTMGKCFISPGMSNPLHHHPNCDEVLHVIRGEIRKRVGDDYFEMQAGDTISIPMGAVHNAENVGEEECELLIGYDSAFREVVGE